jgi:hypothetical protein
LKEVAKDVMNFIYVTIIFADAPLGLPNGVDTE